VSLLWRRQKPLRIGIGPKRLIVSEGRPIEVAQGEGDWRPALQALGDALAARASRQASVVLADQFVRYALLPWNETLKTEEQWLALARHRFGAIHGAAAAEWELKITETAPMGPRLVCAVERALIEALAAKFAAARIALVSVQPFLVAAFNRIRASVGQGSCWIVVEEPRRLTLALIQRGVWMAIRSRRSDERWRAALPEILERESAFLGLAEPCTRVIVCAQGAFDVEMHEAFRAQALDYSELALAGG
jgi:hypothetical protein